MISYYQPLLLPFLQLKSHKPSSKIKRLYYLSWEDALWDLLPQMKVKTGSTILVPDFYCTDVMSNMQLHGYVVKTYPLDQDFQISDAALTKIYDLVKPSVVVLFHACGLTNSLTHNDHLMRSIARNSIIIDDQVHRIVDPSKPRILHDRHLILDSLRKNTPLPGSFVYCSLATASVLRHPRASSPFYILRVTLYFLIYKLILATGVFLSLPHLIKYAHEKSLKDHDDLVGDSLLGNIGLPWVPYIHSHISLSKIRTIKKHQVRHYLTELSSLTKNSSFYIPKIDVSDESELHAFPIVTDLKTWNKLERALSKINVWTKFLDSKWSKSKRVFFLPLGFHITRGDQTLIIQTIRDAYQRS